MKKICQRIEGIRGNLISVKCFGVRIGDVAIINGSDERVRYASVIKVDGDLVTLQVFGFVKGISTLDEVSFVGSPVSFRFDKSILGRKFSGFGKPIDGGPEIVGKEVFLDRPSFNPVARTVPSKMVRTNIPMIDVYNCLVRSQKIPIFSRSGESHNELLIRIAKQTDADVVVCGGMGMVFDDFIKFIDSMNWLKSVAFLHTAVDPVGECLLVPGLSMLAAEQFASAGKHVLVLLTDMLVFADALKEISVGLDQIPSNRGYPGSLYSDLATIYERAVELSTGGSITLLSVTSMPGDDVTHPVPDNTGYITEGQFYLKDGIIDPFGSLSRLKQLVIGKSTREDHGELANVTIRLYAAAKKSAEKMMMGFDLSEWDEKLLAFSNEFEKHILSLEVDMSLENALDSIWDMLMAVFLPQETGIHRGLIEKFRPQWLL